MKGEVKSMRDKVNDVLINEVTKNLAIALRMAQNIAVGLFKFYGNDKIYLVVGINQTTYDVISVSDLFGLQTENGIPHNRGIFIEFPDNKTLTEMMEDVYAFHEWYEKVVTPIFK